MTPPPPTITADTAPREALDAALVWLAQVVPDVTAVRSKDLLRRARGPMRVDVRLQSSTYSRRGVGTWVTLSLSVWDKDFARWRAEHPGMTWRTGEFVHSSWNLPRSLQLFGDETGYRTLAEIPGLLESEWLPVLDMFD